MTNITVPTPNPFLLIRGADIFIELTGAEDTANDIPATRIFVRQDLIAEVRLLHEKGTTDVSVGVWIAMHGDPRRSTTRWFEGPLANERANLLLAACLGQDVPPPLSLE